MAAARPADDPPDTPAAAGAPDTPGTSSGAGTAHAPEPSRPRRAGRLALRLLLVLAGLEALLALPGPAAFLDRVRHRTFQVQAEDVETLTLQSINFDPDDGTPLLRQDPELFWQPGPDLDLTAFLTEVRTDGRGLRSAPFDGPPAPDERRLLVLGDSVTFGFRVAEADRYADVLAARLGERAPGLRFGVVCAGVPGYTSYQGLAWLEEHLDEVAPALVVAGFGVNDALRRRSLSDREYAALHRSTAARWRHALRRSRVVCLVELALAGFHRELDVARGARRRSVSRWIAYPRAEAGGPKQVRCDENDHLLHLDRMRALCAARDIPFVVLTTATDPRAPAHRLPDEAYFARLEALMDAVRAWCDEHDVPLADARAELAAHEGPATELMLDFCHPNEEGHARVAGTLLSSLDEAGIAARLTR